MKVAVVGTGYVGLVTGVGLARIGHDVVCVEKMENRIAALEAGKPPFYEPGLPELLNEMRNAGRISFTRELPTAMRDADVSIIAVGTPSNESGIDLTAIRTAAREIGGQIKIAKPHHVVIVKSTVVPTTTETVVVPEVESASKLEGGKDFGYAMNPEFLREGSAVEDFVNPDRIVLGSDGERTASVLEKLYAGSDCPLIHMSCRNAEMVKYTANALFATMISFANEVAGICEHVPGLSEETVMAGVFEDRRMWTNDKTGSRTYPQLNTYLRGGIGFGGSCFPKDVIALQQFASSAGAQHRMMDAVLGVNKARSETIVENFAGLFEEGLNGRTIGVLGIAFKPDTDDTRESPALRIVNALISAGAKVVAHDYIVKPQHIAQELIDEWGDRFEMLNEAEDVIRMSEGALICTKWMQYGELSWDKLVEKRPGYVLFDGRQVISPDDRSTMNYMAVGIGV